MNSPGKFWIFFGSIWLGVGTIFAVVGAVVLWQEAQRHSRLAADVGSATAVVLAKSMRGGSREEPSYGIEYRFSAADGRVVEDRVKVAAAQWRSLAEGDRFEVRYSRADPRVHLVPGERRDARVLGPVFAAVGSVFALFGAVILWRARAQRALGARLAAEGSRADAEVIEVAPTNFRLNRIPQWAIRYRYRDHVGNVHEAKTGPMPQEEARLWQPGDRGGVRFDPQRPDRGMWVGKG